MKSIPWGWMLFAAVIAIIGYKSIYSVFHKPEVQYLYVGDLAHVFDWFADSTDVQPKIEIVQQPIAQLYQPKTYAITATHANFTIKMSLIADSLYEVKIEEVHFEDTTRVEVQPDRIIPYPRSNWSETTWIPSRAGAQGAAIKSKWIVTGIIGATFPASRDIQPCAGITIGHRKIPIGIGVGLVGGDWIAPLITWRF